jgi:hypothetical protein
MAKIAPPVADYDNAFLLSYYGYKSFQWYEVWAYVISLSLPHFIEVPVPMQVNE